MNPIPRFLVDAHTQATSTFAELSSKFDVAFTKVKAYYDANAKDILQGLDLASRVAKYVIGITFFVANPFLTPLSVVIGYFSSEKVQILSQRINNFWNKLEPEEKVFIGTGVALLALTVIPWSVEVIAFGLYVGAYVRNLENNNPPFNAQVASQFNANQPPAYLDALKQIQSDFIVIE